MQLKAYIEYGTGPKASGELEARCKDNAEITKSAYDVTIWNQAGRSVTDRAGVHGEGSTPIPTALKQLLHVISCTTIS